MARLYANENFPLPAVEELRRLGHDVLTTYEILAVIGSFVYWIEAQSGDYQQHVGKYAKFARLLGLDFEHSFMVLTDVPDNLCDALSSLFSTILALLTTAMQRAVGRWRRRLPDAETADATS